MLRELIKSKIDLITGGGCSCCCKRNPPGIVLYEGIWVGDVDSGSICLSLCNTRKDSLGYMGCIDMSKDMNKGKFGCSTFNNTQLANKIAFDRSKYLNAWSKVNIEILRGISAH